MPKLRRLILDYDVLTKEEVEADARRLNEKYDLGGYEMEPSDTSECWHITFPKTAFDTFEEPLKIAEESKCEKEWLMFCKRYKIFALKTALVKKFQPHATRKVYSRPIKKEQIVSPVVLIVRPKTRLELKRLIKLSESTHDKTWVWSITKSVWNVLDDRPALDEVHIGCRNERQAERRITFIKKLEIEAEFEVKTE